MNNWEFDQCASAR